MCSRKVVKTQGDHKRRAAGMRLRNGVRLRKQILFSVSKAKISVDLEPSVSRS